MEEKRVITGIEQKAAKAFKNIKEGEVTREDHDGTMFETNDITSNKERSPGGYTPLGIEGYEVKTKYDPNKEKASTPLTTEDPKAYLIMGPDSRVK